MESSTGEQGPPLRCGSGGGFGGFGHGSITTPGYRRQPDTGRISPVRNMETPFRSGGTDQPPVGRPRGKRNPGTGQDGQEANGGGRKATGKRGQVTGPSRYGRARITGRIPGRVPGPERVLT